jgi:23S rRNA (uracil1939-C5)-methyltransferase
MEAEVTEVVQAAADRQLPFCQHFGSCGGCQWQHMNYEAQLKYKEASVLDTLERLGKVSVREQLPIVSAEQDRYYRNKLEFTFSDAEWFTYADFKNNPDQEKLPALGFHLPGAYDRVFDVKNCYLQPEPSNQIRLAVKKFTSTRGYEYFNLRRQTGLLRNLMIRTTTTGEVMVVVVFAQRDDNRISELMDFLKVEFPQITSLQYVINSKKNDTIYDLEVFTWSGKETICEKIGDLQFMISAKSFFQTNTRQAERLYECVKDFAGLKGEEVLYDLYTGTGSIALFLARSCKKIAGIEQVEQAVEDAKRNAEMNNIHNVAFFASDISKMLNQSFCDEHGAPDIVVTDPPRAGMQETVVRSLIQMKPEKIVYVSCNVATQARDLQLLSGNYTIERIRPFDLFPHTHHIENVAELKRI